MLDKKVFTILLLCFGILVSLLVYQNFQKEKELEILRLQVREGYSQKQNQNGKPKDFYKDEAIPNTIKKRFAEFQNCYLEFLKENPKQSDGFILTDFQILESGKLKTVGIVTDQLNNKKLQDCIITEFQKLEFPEPPLKTVEYSTYKFHFKKVN
ncbi:MAG: AgmX/PglI C-terminal domain-containing protein [Leptospiraceae bacterium]|nr:AgmX/PglI C-terminal domain-containing protein [Leptospiraceae bacterium]